MKGFTKNRPDINKIEFWTATIIYVISIFLLLSEAGKGDLNSGWAPNRYKFEEANISYSFLNNYLIPKFIIYTVFFGSYLLLTFCIVPPLKQKKNIALNSLLFVTLFTVIAIALGITDTWIKGFMFAGVGDQQEVYDLIFKKAFLYALWLMLLFAIYTAVKYSARYLLYNMEGLQANYPLITREGIIAFVIWMITFFLSLLSQFDDWVIAFYGIFVPFGIGLYWRSLHTLIPQSQDKKRKFLAYLLKVALILLISIPLLSLAMSVFLVERKETIIAVTVINAIFQLLITAPVSWFTYKRRMAASSELTTLRTALGKSVANLDSLKSQINPHFLFNALNTLYGTALQENAERTSEGIQRLGDMMRFMLEENMQDTITLSREIDYINNYISLQKLRTLSSPDILIQTAIDSQVNSLSITPMLLIPFIENAFKHGISLREPSHIKISLQIKGNNLFFDVYNSIHLKPVNDPEKEKSGIGLNNVKQRLQLIYPARHELIIRENAREFFIHLTIQLVKSN